MDWQKWFHEMPLFRAPACCYCGGPADTSDHTPPRCLLPRNLPNGLQAMTIPACTQCNREYSGDETVAAAIVATVSFSDYDRDAVKEGGWLYSARQRDRKLDDFISCRLGEDGIFRVDQPVYDALARVITKTTTGLLFHEFGRLVPPAKISMLAVEHTKTVHPLALVEIYRRANNDWAEVTPSCRELERQVLASCGLVPSNMPAWRAYLPDYFEYLFIRRSNNTLLTGMCLHGTLTAVVECPWPNRAGPRRKGKPTKKT